MTDLTQRATEMNTAYFSSLCPQKYFQNCSVPIEAIRALAMLTQEGSVLDLGCGNGSHAEVWSSAYGFGYTGVDISSAFIDHARGAYPGDFHCTAMHNLACLGGRKFDAIWSACSLEFVPTDLLPQVLSEVHGLMKSGTYWGIVSPDRTETEGVDDSRGLPVYEARKSLDRWKKIFEANGFRCHIDYSGYNRRFFWLIVQSV